jgi:hypothetical protein
VYDAEKEASQHGVHDDFQVRDFNLSRCSPIGFPLQIFSSGFLGRIDIASSGSPHDRTPQ